jgi:hypothetical protein
MILAKYQAPAWFFLKPVIENDYQYRAMPWEIVSGHSELPELSDTLPGTPRNLESTHNQVV